MGIPEVRRDAHFTYGDYRSWPEGERWELIDGTAWEMAGPSRAHQAVVGQVFRKVADFLEGKPCQVYVSPLDVLLPATADESDDEVATVVQPDVVVFCDPEKLTAAGARGAPDLAIEVLSPWNLRHDLDRKFRLYERVGVREYWVADPLGKCVTVFTRRGSAFGEGEYFAGDKALASEVLEGFELAVSAFFPREATAP